jgi:hypothetical protein
MSTRCRHDLLGCKTRLEASLKGWRESLVEVQEVWKDTTAMRYYAENCAEVEGILLRAIAVLQESADQVRDMEKRVADENE